MTQSTRSRGSFAFGTVFLLTGMALVLSTLSTREAASPGAAAGDPMPALEASPAQDPNQKSKQPANPAAQRIEMIQLLKSIDQRLATSNALLQRMVDAAGSTPTR